MFFKAKQNKANDNNNNEKKKKNKIMCEFAGECIYEGCRKRNTELLERSIFYLELQDE